MSASMAAVRVDETLGIRETAEFFGPPARRLFGFRHEPLGEPRGSVLVCSPILAEYRRNYRREFELGRALAADGFVVQRFHYGGTGNSFGERSELTLDTMRADAFIAASLLPERSGSTFTAVVGTRVGAMVAASTVAHLHAHGLILWEPTLKGDDYLRDASRATAIRDMRVAGTRPLRSTAERLREDGWIDALGYTIHRALYDSLRSEALEQSLPEPPATILLITSSSESDRRLSRLEIEWGASGGSVHIDRIDDREPWWLASREAEGSDDAGSTRGIVQLTRAWLRRERSLAWT